MEGLGFFALVEFVFMYVDDRLGTFPAWIASIALILALPALLIAGLAIVLHFQ